MARSVLPAVAPLLPAPAGQGRPPAPAYSALRAKAAVARGERLLDAKQPDEAMKEFDAAVRLDPTCKPAKGEWGRALADFDAVLPTRSASAI